MDDAQQNGPEIDLSLDLTPLQMMGMEAREIYDMLADSFSERQKLQIVANMLYEHMEDRFLWTDDDFEEDTDLDEYDE